MNAGGDSATATVRRSRWWYPLLAVVIGLVPLSLAELACYIFGWGVPEPHLATFENVRPLFVPDSSGEWMVVAENRLGYFRPARFDVQKALNEKRIFCLGGSTVQGRPYATETAFTTWLQLALNAAKEDHDWNVINCGGVSYASYRLTPILQEVLNYQPDLIVLMTGHNEFLEDRELATSDQRALPLRSAELLRQVARPSRPTARAILPEEVDALLDYKGGLEEYQLDLSWRDQVVEQYAENLDAMISLCRSAKTPLVLIAPVSNLRDIPPFKTAHAPGLDDADKARFEKAWDDARSSMQDETPDLHVAATHYDLTCQIDSWHSGAWFELGRCEDALRNYPSALEAYRAARDRDVCPLRMTSALEQKLRALAERTKTPLIDFAALIEAESRDGIPDSQWMLDHVHPTIAGHQLLARRLADWLVQTGVVRVDQPAEWERRVNQEWSGHLQNLPQSYFTTGAKRLASLNRWARGRGDKLRRGKESLGK